MYIFLRDASGKRHFNTSVAEKWADGERRNITRHFDALRKGAPSHARVNIDRDTLEYVEERDTFGDGPATPYILTAKEANRLDSKSPDELLAELEAEINGEAV